MHEPAASPEGDGVDPFGLALDELLHAWSADSDVRREELLARHPALGAEVDEVIELAREIAIVRPQVLPRIPGYEVMGEVGRGGMGVVYRARQHGVDRIVALKVLPETLGGDARGRARFLAEARGLGRIRHDHVVTIHGVVETSDVVAYAMEWVDGRSLASLLEELAGWSRRGPVPVVRFGDAHSAVLPDPAVPWFCRLGIALGRALGEVHRHGLVHRDVKPGNVLLRRNGTPLLSDFGLVRAEAVGLTRTGQVIGTPAFAAPEQLRGDGEAVGPLSDVFALGATLHCVLAGQVPFAGRSQMELLANIEGRRRRPLTERGLPRDLETIVARCVEPESPDRYASADAVADDLENLLALRPVTARPLGVLARAWRLARRNRRLVVASAISGIAVLGACALIGLWIWNLVTLPARFEDALLTARFALLEPTHEERVELAKMGKRPERATAFEATGQQALDAYKLALDLDRGRHDVARERDVVALALQLMQKQRPEPTPTLRAEAPTACTAALAWQEGRDLDAGRLSDASDADRRAVGLLAFLTGRANLCHEAWASLELAGDPFIDAASGQMHLQRGEIGRASARLARATHVWPDAGFLAVAMADCAVRQGDLDVAEAQLTRADLLGLKDPFSSHVRVKADLRAAQGRVEEARELYEWVIARHFGDTARLHYIAMLDRVGDLGRAVDLRLDRFERGSDKDAEGLVVSAWRWWSTRTFVERVTEFEILLDESLGHSRIQRLAVLIAAWRLEGEETRTAASSGSSPNLHEALAGLTFLMELTQMNRRLHFPNPNLVPHLRRALALAPAAASFASSVWGRMVAARAALAVGSSDRLVAAMATVVLVAQSIAQTTLHWTQGTPPVSPSPRRLHMTAVDPPTGDVLVYGGFVDATGSYLADFWRWNGSAWTLIAWPALPGVRGDARMVNVDSTGVVLMFGGGGSAGGSAAAQDTWLWDGLTWTNVTPASSPSPRRYYGLAYDSIRDRVVLHGGTAFGGPLMILNDTWEWHPVSHAWTQVATAPATAPGLRVTAFGMAFDCASGKTLLQGGYTGSTLSAETWAWDGAVWVQVANLAPRWTHVMAWDDAKQRVTLFGGDNGGAYVNTLYEWNGTAWIAPTVTSAVQPTPRAYPTMVFHPATQGMVTFGGLLTLVTASAETWTYTPQPAPLVNDTGPGCNPAASLTPQLSRICGTGPWVGGNLGLEVDDLPPISPSLFSFLIIGSSNPNLPLAFLGAPSCTLRASLDLWYGLGSPATWTWNIPIGSPYGFQFYAQAVSLDFNFFTPVGPGFVTAMSNGLSFTLGSR